MKNRNRKVGFTLVELLVVITIIGMLMALLLPAVFGAKKSMWRTNCSVNLHNLSIAAINHQSSSGRFPAYRITVGGEEVSWMGALFSEIDRRDIERSWKNPAMQPKPTPFLNLLICPGDPPDQITEGEPLQAYLANTRVFTRVNDTDRGLMLSAIRDGSSQTLLFSEGLLNLVPGGRRWTMTDEKKIGFRGDDGADNVEGAAVAVETELKSHHDGGVNAYFCDGHYNFLRSDIAPEVYRQLCDPKDSDEAGYVPLSTAAWE